ncbi:MAG: zinc ABC transporter substrate-binding protein [Thiothrix sp.]
MLRILTVFLFSCWLFSGCQRADNSAKPLVLSTIKPVHALVYAIAGGEHGPLQLQQLLPDGASPHHYALKPSDMQALTQARVVVRIGSSLETFLDKPLASLPAHTLVLNLASVDGIRQLPNRTPHGGEGHEDEHKHETLLQAYDPHIWLSPANALVMSRQIAQVLGQVDPVNQAWYQRNAEQLIGRIQAAEQRIRTQLAPLQQRPYVSFHDAWQHFDTYFGLQFAGAVTLDVARPPGARQVQSIRDIVVNKQAVCLFQEPQFAPALVKTLVAGTNIRLGELDPLGMVLPLNENTYIALLEHAAQAFTQCLRDSR